MASSTTSSKATAKLSVSGTSQGLSVVPQNSTQASSAYTSTYTTTFETTVALGGLSSTTSKVTKIITTTYPQSVSSAPSNTTVSTTSSISTSGTKPTSISSAISSGSSVPLAGSASASKSHRGVSPGAAAGIGIGCAIIGALIALAFAFFFFRNRKDHQSRRNSDRSRKSPSTYVSDKEVMMTSGVAAQRPASPNDLDNLLPQEADDNTVRKKASTLFDQFELHVENFYHDVKVPITPAMEAELSRFSSPHFPEPLVALLKSTSSPTTLIKHCMAHYVITLTSPTTVGPTRSLLPPEISEMVGAMNTRKPTRDTGLAFSRWRQLTAYLRPELLSSSRSDDPSQSRAAQEAAQSFTRVFAPWARSEHSEPERIGHLTHIVNNAVGFAVWLFAQPAAFKYDWKAPADVRDRGGRAVVVVPGLVKVSDGRGQALLGGGEGRHAIVSPVVRKL